MLNWQCVCLCNAHHWRHIVLAISGQAHTPTESHIRSEENAVSSCAVSGITPTDRPTDRAHSSGSIGCVTQNTDNDRTKSVHKAGCVCWQLAEFIPVVVVVVVVINLPGYVQASLCSVFIVCSSEQADEEKRWQSEIWCTECSHCSEVHQQVKTAAAAVSDSVSQWVREADRSINQRQMPMTDECGIRLGKVKQKGTTVAEAKNSAFFSLLLEE